MIFTFLKACKVKIKTICDRDCRWPAELKILLPALYRGGLLTPGLDNEVKDRLQAQDP